MYPKFPLHRSEKLCPQVLRSRVFLSPHQRSNSLSFLLNLPTGFSVRGGRWLDSSSALSQVLSQLIFKVHFHSVFVPLYWDWHSPTHTRDRNFHVSTSRSEQGTQRDHLLLYPAVHVDTHCAKT